MDEEYKTSKSVPVFPELFPIPRILSVVIFLYISQNPMVGGSNKFNSRSFQIFFSKEKKWARLVPEVKLKTSKISDFSSLSGNLSEFLIYIRFCRFSKRI